MAAHIRQAKNKLVAGFIPDDLRFNERHYGLGDNRGVKSTCPTRAVSWNMVGGARQALQPCETGDKGWAVIVISVVQNRDTLEFKR